MLEIGMARIGAKWWRDLLTFGYGPTTEDLEMAAKAIGTPPSDKAELASAAKRVLEDPVVQLALDRVQKRLYDSWRHTQVGAEHEREEAYRLHWAVEELKSELRRMMGPQVGG